MNTYHSGHCGWFEKKTLQKRVLATFREKKAECNTESSIYNICHLLLIYNCIVYGNVMILLLFINYQQLSK